MTHLSLTLDNIVVPVMRTNCNLEILKKKTGQIILFLFILGYLVIIGIYTRPFLCYAFRVLCVE